MRAILATALLLPLTASAQLLAPSDEHYEVAANQIALQRAASELLEAEVVAAQMEEIRAIVEAWDAAKERDELEMLDAHAARIQAWHGLPRMSMVPGTGWHEVTR